MTEHRSLASPRRLRQRAHISTPPAPLNPGAQFVLLLLNQDSIRARFSDCEHVRFTRRTHRGPESPAVLGTEIEHAHPLMSGLTCAETKRFEDAPHVTRTCYTAPHCSGVF